MYFHSSCTVKSNRRTSMISFSTVWAIVLRHLRRWTKDYNLMLAGFYWPLLDILIWGFLGTWIQQSNVAQFHNYGSVALLGILLWQIAGRGCNIIGFAFCEELWQNNVINLFSLPLRLSEYICGIILFYAFMIALTSMVCISAIALLYNVPLWHIITTYLLFAPPLFLCGIWLGFCCLSIVTTLGRGGVELGFVIGWFLAPLSGAYYPIEVLPRWAQSVSTVLPMSYVFKGMRGYLMHQQNPTTYLMQGYILSALYAMGGVLLFAYCFKQSKRHGLARLAD